MDHDWLLLHRGQSAPGRVPWYEQEANPPLKHWVLCISNSLISLEDEWLYSM